jgi:hypothetical protein
VDILIQIETLQLSRHVIFCSILEQLNFSLISLALLDRETATRPHLSVLLLHRESSGFALLFVEHVGHVSACVVQTAHRSTP